MPPLSATRSISTLLEQQHGQWLDWGKFGIRRNYQPNFVSFDQTAGSRKLAVVDASRSIGQNGLFADFRRVCTSKKLDRSPERPLSSNCPI
jgi:hypothetical protein